MWEWQNESDFNPSGAVGKIIAGKQGHIHFADAKVPPAPRLSAAVVLS